MTKKLAFLYIISVLLFYSCKKKDNTVSHVAPVSFPIIKAYDTTYQGPDLQTYYLGIDPSAQIYYYSFPVGKAPALQPTAYDSGTHAAVPVTTVIDGHLDPNSPGLYIYEFSAKSTNGFASRVMFMIAVTNIPSGYDLSGTYYDTLSYSGFVPSQAVIQKMANGLYMNSDGVPGTGALTFFVQTDSMHIVFPQQLTNYNSQGQGYPYVGMIGSSGAGTVTYAPGDTTIQYKLASDTLNLNGLTATFIKP